MLNSVLNNHDRQYIKYFISCITSVCVYVCVWVSGWVGGWVHVKILLGNITMHLNLIPGKLDYCILHISPLILHFSTYCIAYRRMFLRLSQISFKKIICGKIFKDL